MNASDPQVLIEKLRSLPSEEMAEVEDFVDFLAGKQRRRAAFDRLLAIAPALRSAGAEPMTEEDVVALVREVRAERRGQRESADRS